MINHFRDLLLERLKRVGDKMKSGKLSYRERDYVEGLFEDGMLRDNRSYVVKVSNGYTFNVGRNLGSKLLKMVGVLK